LRTQNGKFVRIKSITINDLLNMPVAERLRLVEDLWDGIAEMPKTVELSDAQRKELDERLEQYHRNPEAGSPWKDVKERILKHG
jgi:putative addiction module component (TIGR02574 family)